MLVIFAVFGISSPASAHKMYIFAETRGAAIHGEAYFRGGAPARDLVVKALGPAGEGLGETKTDENGKFSLEAKSRCDHRLVVETPDGHGAECMVSADRLPGDLSPRGQPPEVADKPAVVSSIRDVVRSPARSAGASPPEFPMSGQSEPPTPSPARSAGSADADPLQSLRDEIAGLRASLNAYQKEARGYQQETRLRDVLGGIGWIVGMAGIASYFLARRRKQDTPG
jgi:hypothetical protein